MDVTLVVATLYEPPTLAPLVAAAESAGAAVEVVRGKRTNHAWNEGIGRTKTRYVVVANDDIIVYPKNWMNRLVGHHKAGGWTWLTGVMWPSIEIVTREGLSRTTWLSREGTEGLVIPDEPVSKGHLFSMDMEAVACRPIPDDLTVYYGDNWHYLWHKREGKCGYAMDVLYRTGEAAGFEGMSGWTARRPELTEFLGCTLQDVEIEEHQAAKRYFTFDPARAPKAKRAVELGFQGVPTGLLNE